MECVNTAITFSNQFIRCLEEICLFDTVLQRDQRNPGTPYKSDTFKTREIRIREGW